MKEFLNKFSYNFGRISEINLLGKGGENIIYQVEPFVPIECVAKVSLVDSTIDLLEENHYLKLAAHPSYVCRVLEEIVIYNTKFSVPIVGVAIIE